MTAIIRLAALLLAASFAQAMPAKAINVSPFPGATVPPGYVTSPGASAGWSVAADSFFDAPNSLKSGAIADGQRADIETTVTTGEGTMSFARRVSSEAGFDFLRFYIDGVEIAWWSGEVAWEEVSFAVSAGAHVFRWSYQKDGSDSRGMDAAWVDSVTFPEPSLPQVDLVVTFAGTGSGSVDSSPPGIDCSPTSCGAAYANGTVVTLTPLPAVGSTFAGWSGACSGTGTCTLTMNAPQQVTATFGTAAGGIAASPALLDFGGQSINTTAPPRVVTLGNPGTSPATISSLTASTWFAVSHDCGPLPAQLAAGASCRALITFTPTTEDRLNGTLSIQTGAGTQTVALAGEGEESLVTHYYQSILRRAPDPEGKSYWDSEAARAVSLGINVNETWYAMASAFYASPEYLAFGRDDTGYVTDLFNTFFNRAPDAGGLAFWVGQIRLGMPRDVVLVEFMFSTEFTNFTQAIFGNTQVRKEIDTVVDFYRGFIARLPDDTGFRYWLQQFRTAQCQAAATGSGAPVYAQVDSISSAFLNSTEYGARGRTNAQYVSDLYNAFLRRGGDLGGVQYWISQLDSGARTRDNVRREFMGSPEFNVRILQIIAEGCVP